MKKLILLSVFVGLISCKNEEQKSQISNNSEDQKNQILL